MSLDKSPPVFYLWLPPVTGVLRVGFPLSWGVGRVHGRSQDAQDFLAFYGVGLLSQLMELSTGKLMGSEKQ